MVKSSLKWIFVDNYPKTTLLQYTREGGGLVISDGEEK